MQYRVSTLVFVKNERGEHLLLRRKKSPNLGCWTPVGGKLDMETGESPYECAQRELFEETGHQVRTDELHMVAMIAEKGYEGKGHWLLFLFDCQKPIEGLPEAIDEGDFGFYSREAIEQLIIPETDRQGLWATYDKYLDGFVAMRVDCGKKALDFVVEGEYRK